MVKRYNTTCLRAPTISGDIIGPCTSVVLASDYEVLEKRFFASNKRIAELEAALRNISMGAKRYWREGEDAYQFALLADAALAGEAK